MSARRAARPWYVLLRTLPAVSLPLVVWVVEMQDFGDNPHPSPPRGTLPLVLVAAASGVTISAAVPQLWLAVLTSALAAFFLTSASIAKKLHLEEELPGSSNRWLRASKLFDVADAVHKAPGPLSGVVQASLRGALQEPTVELKTFSVVLPCAYEGEYASRTVEAVWRHTKAAVLKEIIVVDDGSKPELELKLPPELQPGGTGPPVRLIRHNATYGLIKTKQTGGDAAEGDVIVFFDCHVKPRDGWEDAFIRQMTRAGDHRTVVVPTITSLDPGTWEELTDSGSKACYMLWNADFPWLTNPGRDVPIMSGGLLAMTRRWWHETGGYDKQMVVWGGENIEQSLKTWLCGGRIEVAQGAFVAHMWRVASDPRTQLKYPFPTEAVMRNKARAATGWMDEFKEKALSFIEYEDFRTGVQSVGNMDNYQETKDRLQCKPFSWYLDRFSYVYADSGMIAESVFQVKELSTGLCMERFQKGDHLGEDVILAQCADRESGRGVIDLQQWHISNRDTSRPGAPCCSGLANWNLFRCVDAAGIGYTAHTSECDILGFNANQGIRLREEDGQIILHGPGRKGCLAPMQPFDTAEVQETHVKPCPSTIIVEELQGGSQFRLKTNISSFQDQCLTFTKAEPFPIFRPQQCRENSQEQVFQKVQLPEGAGYLVKIKSTCLDSSSGGKLIAYGCYPETAPSPSQVWQILKSRLLWETACLDLTRAGEIRFTSPESSQTFALSLCADKPGQRFSKEDIKVDGSFILRDEASGDCLGDGLIKSANGGLEKGLRLGPCIKRHRWKELLDTEQVQHVGTGFCLDANNEATPILYPCHKPRAQRKQRFQVKGELNWLQLKRGWEDNGRKKFFERCIDSAPKPPVLVHIVECDDALSKGVKWQRLDPHESLEMKLWRKAQKPPPGALPLGGDKQPP